METPKVNIRIMTLADISAVAEIEQLSFKLTNQWPKHLFRRHCSDSRGPVCVVAQIGRTVVGFYIYELHRDHFRILNMAVHPDYRKQGVCRQLIERLQGMSGPTKRRSYIEVLLPTDCLGAQTFFTRFGVKIQLTDTKGEVTYRPIFSAMTATDAREAQAIEDDIYRVYGGWKQRNIEQMLKNYTCYGLVARDQRTNVILGYALYT